MLLVVVINMLSAVLTNYFREEPEEKIIQALEVAGEFSNGVAPPYYVEKKIKMYTYEEKVITAKAKKYTGCLWN